jgi:phosphoribosyl 1,2-cyclic phosphate phosphodiesterase
MTLTFTILGCGSSGGVPRVGAGWGACDPGNPKNRRRRCSLLVERQGDGGSTHVLIDTTPDVREQLLDARVDRLDAVLFTHEHADHTHGIDDLRVLAIHQRQRIPVYLDEPTSAVLRARFRYCFENLPGSSYPPILNEHRLRPGRTVTIDGAGGPIEALPFVQDHGDIAALGFRFDGLAYSADLKVLPPESMAALAGLDVWIVDALRYKPHPSHFSVDDALAAIARVRPRRAILTNMHVDLDYEALRVRLPAHVEPAYDGMRIVIGDAPALTPDIRISA